MMLFIAKVEWTPRAEEYLKNKEYKYLSPVVMGEKKGQKSNGNSFRCPDQYTSY